MEASAASTSQLDVVDKIRQVLEQHARLSVDIAKLRDADDLYEAGMSSQASVNVMLGLEDAFDVEFPDSMLRRNVFESISAIRAAIGQLLTEAGR
jgi:acyl carrier protein